MNNAHIINKTHTKCKSCKVGPSPARKCHKCDTIYCACCAKWYTVVSVWYIIPNSLFTNNNKHKKQLTTTRITNKKLRTCDLCIIKNKESTVLKLIRNNQEQKLHELTKLPKKINHIIINYMYAPKPRQRPPAMSSRQNEPCILC